MRYHLLFLLMVSITLLGALPVQAKPELLDRIVAVVDDQVILWSDLKLRLTLELEQRGQIPALSPEEDAKLTERIIDDMIDERVLILKAQKDSLVADESRVEGILAEQLQMLKNRLGPDNFSQTLTRTGFTERQVKSRLRKDISHLLLFEQMRARLTSRLYITHREIEEFRQAYRDTLPSRLSFSQINIKVKPDSVILARVRQKIEEIQRQLKDGEDFAEMARRYSEDPGTASIGGDLGCFQPGDLAPAFEEAAFQLKPGQISEPVLTPYGYHLIRLREKRENDLCTSHILIRAPVGPQDQERTRQQLETLRTRALAGEDFAQLAKTYSEDPQTARYGGQWQILPKDQIPPFLQPYVSHLKLGEISESFFLEDGGHILKLNDDQATLEGMVREARLMAAMRQLIEDYKRQLHIEKRLDEQFLKPPKGYGTSRYLHEEHRPLQAAQ